MSTVSDVSGKLGEYMLKGWVLTDKICSKCSNVPLMRSPSGPSVYFCANCSSDFTPPTSGPSSSRSGLPTSVHVSPSQPARIQSGQLDKRSSVSSASSMIPSRTSTPPTEVSNVPSSPIFAPAADMEEILRRRQQSDTASAEIGRRMLRGWAMLADECPNRHCYGIPLVRPPKAGGEKDPRKECVICGTVYVDEERPFGTHLVPVQTTQPNGNGERVTLLPQPQPAPQLVPDSRPQEHQSTATARQDGKAVTRLDAQPSSSNMAMRPSPFINLPPPSLDVQAVIQTLEGSLHALSSRLEMLSSGPVIEPTLIAQTADAISKVALALAQVGHLR